MKDHVVPTMGTLLTAFDSTEFPEVGCPTCHGPDPQSRNFEMPSASLPALPRPGTPDWDHEQEEHPRMFAMMATRVVPTMAQILGLPAYDPATNQGFGCFNCHTMEQ